MGFLSRLIRFVFWVLIVSWVIRLVGRLFSGGRQASVRETGAAATRDSAVPGKRLVKDPVCGMHLAKRSTSVRKSAVRNMKAACCGELRTVKALAEIRLIPSFCGWARK
jgi:hypothetical protein